MVKELTPKQLEVILEFIKIGKVEEACKQAGIAKSTYYEWLKIPEFQAELKQQQEQVYESTVSSMKYLLSKAVETQEQLLNSENERVRLRVSSAIINNAVKIFEMANLNKRLQGIEKHLDEMEQLKELRKKLDEKRI
ncbi:MAG: hypothetical protein A2Y25_06000 [Candidatus Melainabacteria bacterium GWF2_37_15]|nr:MAG: hypothetical protein A2Y25_06000 [Candidatus Melainabacteria bacterium GWF2_37_15]